jgi:hypothetical protein
MIEQWARAIQKHEGWFNGSRSFRNNNPGNLRYTTYTASLGKNKGKDNGNFIIYVDYETGFSALKQFLKDAATDVLRAYRGTMTIYDFYSVYAPSGDGNYPKGYAEAVAADLGVSPKVKISTLFDPVASPAPKPVPAESVPAGKVISQKQGDPKWGGQQIGQSNTTLEKDGCLITDISDYLYWLGKYKSPKELAQILRYTPAGKIYWQSIDEFTDAKFVYRYWNFNADTRRIIDAAINHPTMGVFLEVEFRSGLRHWLWALSTRIPRYKVADPLYGDFGNTLLRYGGRVVGAAILDRK